MDEIPPQHSVVAEDPDHRQARRRLDQRAQLTDAAVTTQTDDDVRAPAVQPPSDGGQRGQLAQLGPGHHHDQGGERQHRRRKGSLRRRVDDHQASRPRECGDDLDDDVDLGHRRVLTPEGQHGDALGARQPGDERRRVRCAGEGDEIGPPHAGFLLGTERHVEAATEWPQVDGDHLDTSLDRPNREGSSERRRTHSSRRPQDDDHR